MCIVDGVCYKYYNYIYKSIIHPASEAWAWNKCELFTTVAPATSVSQSMLVRNKMQAETPER